MIHNSKEDKFKRLVVSILATAILVAYTIYIISRKFLNGSVELDTVDYTVLTVCLAVMLAVEALKYAIRRQTGAEKNDDKDAV